MCGINNYLKNGECKSVTNKIANCDFYQNSETCYVCSVNHVLSVENKCLHAQGCLNHSEIKCDQCQVGYFLNPNKLQNVFLDFDSTYSKNEIVKIMLSYSNNIYDNVKAEVCEKVDIEGCTQYSSKANCTLCIEGYYLSEAQICVKFPTPKIDNCLLYKNSITCLECENQYYLVNNACTEVKAIDNCSSYGGAKSYTLCIECSEEYFLVSNSCTERIRSVNDEIENCKTKNPYEDNCLECTTGYVLSVEGFLCLDSIPDCEEYLEFFENSSENYCKQCASGYYLNDKFKCSAGSSSLTNCEVFKEEELCVSCSNSFYLDENECLSSQQIEDCDVYSNTLKNSC